ncbi:MAG: efflux RND transporter permease subunit [Blautia sp.]|nr:efflux RND transporter permease subunit [Blautia sp.]
MISRFSVRKPYTVVVAIVLVLILGVVSFGKMSTDLLPSMTLPYAIIMTTYQGASPETVEMVVTKPVEQSMATVANIENVSSRSSENMSIVILEFGETTNMDSATIDIREKLDQISGYWDDSVGKPMIMKLNPDMLPIMVAAVEVDGLEDTEVTDYVQSHIEAEIESVAGVASVSTTGNITESVEVILRADKIKAVNKKVAAAIDGKFKEKEEELDDAKKELDDGKEKLEEGKEQLEEGKAQLESGKEELANGLASGQQQIIAGENEINAGLAEIDNQLRALDDKEKELKSGLEQIDSGISQIAEGIVKAQEGAAQAESGIQSFQQMIDGIGQLLEARVGLENTKNEIETNLEAGLTQINTQFQTTVDLLSGQKAAIDAKQEAGEELLPEEAEFLATYEVVLQQVNTEWEGALAFAQQTADEGKTQVDAGIAELDTQLSALAQGVGQSTPEGAIQYANEQIASIQQTVETLNAQVSELQTQKSELETKKEALVQGQAQIDEGRQKLNAMRSQVAAGKAKLDAGKVQMTVQQVMGSIELSVAQSKLDSGSLQLTQNEEALKQAEEQLEEGMKQLTQAKKDSKKQANLKNLLTKDMLKGILTGQNFSMPAGYIQEGEDEYLVRVGDKFTGTDTLEEMIVLDMGLDGLDPIKLGDVADVIINNDSDSVYARLNGNPGVILTIEKQTGYSTGDVTDRLLERIAQIEEERTETHFSVLMDQGVYIDLVVDSVLQNMLYGAILAIIVLLLFMKDLRPTIVIAFSIPISVVTAIVLMYFTGITLNIISLSGLALGIGMLVDNSIVVIENIDRLRQLGVPPRKAAVEGANQVAGAIAASTLTTICVFAPIVFTEGITRQLFVDMGLTIAFSLIASLVVAMTLVPMMSAGLLKNMKPKKHGIFDWIRNVYGNLLRIALKVKLLVLLLAVGMLIYSAKMAVEKGTAFMPEMESTQATLTISVEKGQTFADLTEAADRVIEAIEDIEDIDSIGAMAGGSGIASMMGSSGTADSVTAYLVLKEDKVLSSAELEAEIRNRVKDIPCTVDITTQTLDMSALGGSGIAVQIKGKDLDTLTELSWQVARILAETEGTKNVSDGLEDSDKEFRVVINKAKAMKYKLTVAQIYQELQKRLAKATASTTLSTPEKDYSVYVHDESDETIKREDIRNMKLKVTDSDGEEKKIRVSEIADFEEAEGPRTIMRDAQSRYMTVSAEIETDYNVGLVSAEVAKKLADLELPKGYTAEMVGEDQTINEAMEQLVLMLVLALAFMYLIMVAQFQSLLSPFIIMFTVPLAFTGGFLGLVIADMEVSVIAMVGFVMLSGIIVNNGIVLVDYTNQLRGEGMDKREALVQAGRDRLRPIIMTALTTILGLSTMAAGNGMGSDMTQPMAVVTIGGLLYGTLLTLFVVPCIYDLLNRRQYKTIEIEEEV